MLNTIAQICQSAPYPGLIVTCLVYRETIRYKISIFYFIQFIEST